MVTRTRRVDDARRNERTRLAVDARALRRPVAVDDDERSWADALERIHTWRAEHPDHAALAVVVRTDAGLEVTLRQAHGAHPLAVVVGRHAKCDVHLPREGSASLRHAALLLWPAGASPWAADDVAADARFGERDPHMPVPAIAGPEQQLQQQPAAPEPAAPSLSSTSTRVVAVDLRSAGGLVCRDGRVARRMSSARALHFGAGDADVFALVAAADEPFPIRYADQLDAEVTGALVDERSHPPPSPSPVRPSWEKSVVIRTRLQRQPIPEDAVVVRATPADVDRGLVLGREERCHRTTAIADDDNVSRVHAVLLAVDDELWLVDAASTNGTAIVTPRCAVVELGEKRRIARLPLDARVELSGTEVVVVIDG